MEWILQHADLVLIIAACAGFFMAWGIGANDVANAMGTSVGSRAVSIKQAFIIAAVFEFTGAYLAGGEVTKTIRKGMIDSQVLMGSPDLVIYGMLASLLAAGIWLLVASRAGWPVSTTHSIVGAIVGFAAVGIGMDAVQWGKVGTIVLVISPALSGVIAYWLFVSVQRFILDTSNPLESAKRYVPVYIFLVGFIIALVTLFKGLKHVGLHLTPIENYLIAAAIGFVVMILLVGTGLIGVFDAYPITHNILKAVSVAYLLWLACFIKQFNLFLHSYFLQSRMSYFT